MNFCVTEEALEKIEFGHLIEVVVKEYSNRIIDYEISDLIYLDGNTLPKCKKGYRFDTISCAGLSNKRIETAALIPIADANKYQDVWYWSSWEVGRLRENDRFNPNDYVGWWLQPYSIHRIVGRAEKVFSKIETPPIPCVECKEFYDMAVPNFEEKLVCWPCWDSMRWKYQKDTSSGLITLRA